MTTPPAPRPDPLDEIACIADPTARARAAVAFTAAAEMQARRGRALRDEALRALKTSGVSIPKIAERTGVNIATVKAVLR